MLGPTGDRGAIAGEARHAERLGFDLAAAGEHVFFHGPVANAFVTTVADPAAPKRRSPRRRRLNRVVSVTSLLGMPRRCREERCSRGRHHLVRLLPHRHHRRDHRCDRDTRPQADTTPRRTHRARPPEVTWPCHRQASPGNDESASLRGQGVPERSLPVPSSQENQLVRVRGSDVWVIGSNP
jgi:hypothetical protein